MKNINASLSASTTLLIAQKGLWTLSSSIPSNFLLVKQKGAIKNNTLAIGEIGYSSQDIPSALLGDVLYKGNSILKMEPHTLIQNKMMCLVPEGRHIFGNLTVEENLQMACYGRRKDQLHDMRTMELFDLVYDLFPRLYERRKQRSELLSGGEQQMVAVGRALMTNCDFIMLDEPSMGLAPKLMFEMFRALKRLNIQKEMTLLVVEQNAKVALDFADRGYVLRTGEIIASGTSAELSANPEVQKAYLGG